MEKDNTRKQNFHLLKLGTIGMLKAIKNWCICIVLNVIEATTRRKVERANLEMKLEWGIDQIQYLLTQIYISFMNIHILYLFPYACIVLIK